MQTWKSGPDDECVTKYLTADIYSCKLMAIGCRFAMPFGYDVFCQHQDRKEFSLRDGVPAVSSETGADRNAASCKRES